MSHNAMQPVYPVSCDVCGGKQFGYHPILWEGLIRDWELSAQEVDYINHQQGIGCVHCGSSLRSMVLAKAILDYYDSSGSLADFVVSHMSRSSTHIIEINPAGSLTPYLSRMPHHRLCSYPDFDLMALELPSVSADLIVHSDTLEHIPDPVLALKECWRVLKPGGACCFTVPTIVGRMSRSRSGLKPSYHGAPNTSEEDQTVHTEFGADVWTYVLSAGFEECRIVSLCYPAGLAFIAIKKDTTEAV